MANHTQQIEIFSTGMSFDLRKIIRVNRRILRPFQSLQHFDVYPDRLVPKRDWVAETTNFPGGVTKVARFEYFDDVSAGTYTLWGLGLTTGTFPTLIKKQVDPITGAWTSVGNGVSASGQGFLSNPWLFGHKGYLYYMTNSALARYNVTTGVRTDNFQAFTIGTTTNTCKPVIHPRTGSAYFAIDNSLYQVDPTGTWVGLVQTLPSDKVIVSMTPYGNTLAIGTYSTNSFVRSTTYLWDLTVTASPTSINFQESIDWGIGNIKHIANLFGTLVGITDEFLSANTASLNKGKFTARVYSGSTAQEVNYLRQDLASLLITNGSIENTSYSDGEKLYFAGSIPLPGQFFTGIWSIDRGGAFLLEATVPAAEIGNRIAGIYRVGYVWFLTFTNGNTYRTSTQTSTTLPSIMETAIYGDRFNSNQFFGATVSFEPLTSGQSVTLKYKLPNDTAWKLMKSQAVVGATQIQALGTNLNQSPTFNEYQFRVESLGAPITGLSWTTEGFDTNIYS